MGNPRDRLDDWLNTEVEPLSPPPGTFGRIRLRARRRKVSRVVMSAAGVVVVVAAGVAIPRIAASLQGNNGHGGQPVAVGTPPASTRPNATGNGPGRLNSKSSSPVPPSGSALSAQGSGNPVPPNFQPTSVTFVGPHIGAVIGQAGTPGHCATAYCTSLAGTSDYGSTWYGVSAPLTGPPEGSQGVSQIRFLNPSDGWAFGPQLYVTHNGGATWAGEPTKGMRVTDLETVGDRAFALFATCSGKGAAYAADCTSFALYTSVSGSNQWLPVSGPTGNLTAAAGTSGAGGAGGAGGTGGQAASASLVLTGGPASGRGYLLAPSGELLSGPLTGAAWTVADQQAPCQPGPPGSSGQPAGGLLAADPAQLVLVCTSATSTAGDSQTLAVYESSDNGAAWSKTGSGAAGGIAASLAIQAQGGLVMLATDAGLFRSTDGGSTWQQTQASPGGGAGAGGEHGFSYVGMTSPLDGVALPADANLHEVFITTNGGLTWRAHAVSAP